MYRKFGEQWLNHTNEVNYSLEEEGENWVLKVCWSEAKDPLEKCVFFNFEWPWAFKNFGIERSDAGAH